MSNEPEKKKESLNRSYGLGIFSTTTKLEQTFEENAVRYEYEEKTGLLISKWKGEKPSAELRFPDGYFERSLENVGGGMVITAKSGSDESFEFSSIVEKSGSDIIFIIAEENSHLHIFETIIGENPVFFGRNLFVSVGKGASITFANTVSFSAESVFLSYHSARVSENGKMEWHNLRSGAEMTRSLTEDILAGKEAESSVYDMSLCSEGNFDVYNITHHKADNTTSHILARGIAGGGGKIVYRALSDIGEGVSGATSRQDGRFLIASSGAEVDAIPSLDIGSSESSSSHALSISHLRDTDYFYPALRGINPYRAQAMLLSGFLSKPLEKLPPKWQTAFLDPINKKLSSPMYRFD